ncbi:DUF5988 family protein [Actinomadura roseirufa]|uniref:DUF5988 family protein n=1 Tax=Actinomadura roseirufa TaxID=2094049 RepID=UPI001041428B|nr:DUF5988 family protein [Actinomadura roseirufa]
MNGQNSSSRTVPIDVVLVGGPDDLPDAARKRRAPGADQAIKVLHRGGYEHFQPDDREGDPDAGAPRVFRWTMRTRIAE